MKTIESARMPDYIKRSELAKMISVYAMVVVGKTKLKGYIPYYPDIMNMKGDLRNYILLSYQLGLM